MIFRFQKLERTKVVRARVQKIRYFTVTISYTRFEQRRSQTGTETIIFEDEKKKIHVK